MGNYFIASSLIEQNFEVVSGNSSTSHTNNQLNPLSFAQTLVYVVFPLTCAIQFITTICTSSSFAKYANSWTTFEEKFQEIFKISSFISEPVFPRTIRFHRFAWNFTIFLVVLMGLTIYPMMKAQELLATSSIKMTWPVHLVSGLTILTSLLLDLRSNLMLFINEEAFSQVKYFTWDFIFYITISAGTLQKGWYFYHCADFFLIMQM